MEKKNFSAKLVLAYILILLLSLMLFGCNAASKNSLSTEKNVVVNDGYRAVCYDGKNFVAVGTQGHMDSISPDKTVTPLPTKTSARLNGVASMDGTRIVVGDGGVILVSKEDEDFKIIKSGVKSSLNSVTYFQNAFWVAGSQGILLKSTNGEKWTQVKSGTQNDILSIASNNQMSMAVTRQGQILMSSDGMKWKIIDYNVVYKGYDEPCWFSTVNACGDTFFIVGQTQKDAGVPVIISSETGDVWRHYAMQQVDGKPYSDILPLTVNRIAMNWDQLTAICNAGKLLTITECSECNTSTTLTSNNINDLAATDGKMALVGDAFWFDVQDADAFRQYKILPEQAKKDMDSGAIIVDVRTADEYKASHVKNAVHIPLDQIDKALTTIIPDKNSELIFYCAKGVRAQQALEKSLTLGYQKVYNMGGLSDWPYDTEAGSEGCYSGG